PGIARQHRHDGRRNGAAIEAIILDNEHGSPKTGLAAQGLPEVGPADIATHEHPLPALRSETTAHRRDHDLVTRVTGPRDHIVDALGQAFTRERVEVALGRRGEERRTAEAYLGCGRIHTREEPVRK